MKEERWKIMNVTELMLNPTFTGSALEFRWMAKQENLAMNSNTDYLQNQCVCRRGHREVPEFEGHMTQTQ